MWRWESMISIVVRVIVVAVALLGVESAAAVVIVDGR